MTNAKFTVHRAGALKLRASGVVSPALAAYAIYMLSLTASILVSRV